MAKAQGKKAVGGSRKPAKPAARVKGKGPAKAKPAAKKSAPVRAAKKAIAKPVKKVVSKTKKAAKAAGKATKKLVAKAVKPAKVLAKPKKASPKPLKVKEIKAVKPAKATAPKAAPKAPQKAAPKAALKSPAPAPPKAGKPGRPAAAKAAPAASAPRPPVAVAAVPKPAEPEKKRGRRARPRVHSDGVPVAAWLSTEKPRPASFIPAPPRAEAPAAIAAPPASSDRLLRPDDIEHPAVRTVPVRIDVEQGAGRFYVIANPNEVSVGVGEGIEWDFRYLGGADVTVEEIAVEFDKPSPFPQALYRTRKPGGARPHRALSGGALPAARGKRIEYVVRAMTPFKTELASTKIWVNVNE